MMLIIILISSLLVLLSCEPEDNPTFTLTTTVSPTGAGTILPTQTSFNKGETAVLEAVPTNGWRFVRWEGDLTSYGNPVNLGMTRDYVIIGVFMRADFYETEPITDIDGNIYKTVGISSQNWMAENLRTSKYRNGDLIPNVTNGSTWAGLTTGAWVNYDNIVANDAINGKFYNWYAVADARKVCPTGWHIPSDAEWTVLSNFLGTNAGQKMKSTTGWINNGNGSNMSGFNGLPGGYRRNDGTFRFVGRDGLFWSSSEIDSGNAWNRYLHYNNPELNRDYLYNNKRNGFLVRCLRD